MKFVCLLMLQFGAVSYCLAQTGNLVVPTSATTTDAAIRIGQANDPGTLAVPPLGVTARYNIDYHTYRDIANNQIGARIGAERINMTSSNNALWQGMNLTFHTSDGSAQTALTERMRIAYNGNIGLGETTPLARLHVTAQQTTGTAVAWFGQSNVPATDGFLKVVNSTNGTGYFIPGLTGRSSFPGHSYGVFLTGEAEDVTNVPGEGFAAAVIIDGRSKVGSRLNNNNVFAVNTYGNNLMMVKADGSVGIGTTDTKGYKLAVNGSGIFTRVKVKAFSAWPDYVFADGYDLPSLPELEKYVSEHQHLPGIPSAGEVAEHGIDLGDMNQQLLQKVEELTLYIIELNKKLEAQDKVISTLINK